MTKANTTRANVWKLEDAKARFSELVRKARTGTPQTVTVHGKAAVVVVDSARFEVRPKPRPITRRAIFEGEFFDEEDVD
jgi:antitoxin Phd